MSIEAARRVPIESLVEKRGVKLHRQGRRWLAGPCVVCGGDDRFAVNTEKGLWNCRGCDVGGDVIDLVRHIDKCSVAIAVAALLGEATPRAPRPMPVARPRNDRDEATKRLALAHWLWGRRKPIAGTPAETYLRRARGISGPLPSTVGYLAPSAKYPDPTLIAAFGLATEIDMAEHERRRRAERGMPLPTPGWDDPITVTGAQPVSEQPTLYIPDHAVVGVHLIKLLPDGSDRRRDIKDAKIIIGIDFFAPIILAPANNALALTIGEGIEKVLAAREVTGAGAWAAASAGRLPGLAALVPSYIECVTVLVDDNEIGRDKSAELAAKLDARGFEVLLTPTGAAS